MFKTTTPFLFHQKMYITTMSSSVYVNTLTACVAASGINGMYIATY